MKWRLQRTAQELLPHERVAFCMRRIQATTVDVLYSPTCQSAHYSGLMVCGSIWVCPLRAAQKLRKQFGILGTVSVREVTWSKLNGWHPHCHELVFCSTEIGIDEYDKTARSQWQRSVEHEGLSINEHGFSVSRTYGSVADYVTKFGREPLHSPWGAATEMSKGYLKRGHTQEHLTPFAMLLLISQGCHELKPVCKEFAQWFKGKHQLVWSAGLRLLLLGNTEEKTDEELVQEEENDVVLLGQLTSTQWSFILAHDAQGRLLEIARSGDWQEVLGD